jgi:probable HAF family extracellular repeat protein
MNPKIDEDLVVRVATERVSRRLVAIGLSTIIGLGFLLTAVPLRAQATFTPLGFFGGGRSRATDISADGSVIVGTVALPGPAVSIFRVAPQGMTVRATGLQGDENSIEPGVSNDGSTVVGTFQSQRGAEAFRWVGDGPLEGLGALPGGTFESSAFGVSADGSVVVGTSQPNSQPTAFRWTAAGGMLNLGGNEKSAKDVSADGSVVVGSLGIGNGPRSAYRWTAQTGSMVLPPLVRPQFLGAEALAVDADGSVVVGINTFRVGLNNINEEAFRWTEQEGTVSLVSPGWSLTVPRDISADGSVIVGRGLNITSSAAFYWTSETGMLDLRDLLIFGGAMNLDGWTLVSADGISDDGRTVAGTALGPNGQEAFVATISAIPEPSTVGLAVVAGLGVLAVCFRRKPLKVGR